MINKSNLIVVNLNQTFSSTEIKEKKDENIRWVFFSILISALIGNLIWFTYINLDINNLIYEREVTILNLIDDTNKLKQKGQINLSKKDIENLYKVESKRVTWADKFKELALITPEDMAITGLKFRNNKLIIDAVSLINENEKEFSIVENLIKKIENNEVISKDFKKIQFKSSERKITRGQEVLVFVVEAKLGKPI